MTIISLSEPIPLTIALTLFGVMAAYTSQTVCDGSLIPFRIMMVLALTSLPVVGALVSHDARAL